MSWIVADVWQVPTALVPAGVTAGVPVNFTTITVPYSAAAGYSGGYQTLASATTANTNQLYSFTYTPVRNPSYVLYLAYVDIDRNANVGPESLYVFINNTAYSQSYSYPRVSGDEPWQSRCQSGVYNNTTGGTLSFSLRVRNGSGWTNYIGSATTANQVLSNTIQIIEYAQ
jgi:hypothetical protein